MITQVNKEVIMITPDCSCNDCKYKAKKIAKEKKLKQFKEKNFIIEEVK